MRLSGKLVLAALVGVVTVFGTAAESLGASTVTLGKPVIKANGTAVLPVTVAAPGLIVLWDAQTLQPCGGPPRIKKVTVTITQPGTLRLPVRPEAQSKPDLRKAGRLKVPVGVEYYAPGTDTNPEEYSRTVVLRLKPDAKSRVATAVPRC